MKVSEAFSIDTKLDDGLPQSGKITAMYASPITGFWGAWAGAADGDNAPTTAATAASSSTCYDNGNVGGATQRYSMAINSGNNPNCAISLQFQ